MSDARSNISSMSKESIRPLFLKVGLSARERERLNAVCGPGRRIKREAWVREALIAALDREEASEAMFEAIEDLPEAQREVLVATELEGRSFKELAEEWNIPLGTLLARKHRAIRALRETLTGGVVA